jgi:phospholipase/carboxylesterase
MAATRQPETGVIDAIDRVLSPLLESLERIVWVQRHLYPPIVSRLADELAPCAEALTAPLSMLQAQRGAVEHRFMQERLIDVATRTVDLLRAFVEAARSSGDLLDVYRVLRRFPAVQEALYPLAPALAPVSRWFLEPSRRDDDGLIERLRAAALREDGVQTGVLHSRNTRESRGGCSLYVPESWDGKTPMPLCVALHGGHGHGCDFLWIWLREARSRGVLVLAPTSRDRTWSIMGGQDADAEPLREMVEAVAARYPVDRERVLLTGMSDGGTYALLCGLNGPTPFTHLAPLCGVLHPLLFTNGGIERARGRPVYLVHGALDWMFPVHTARMAHDALAAAGARLVYRELEDLSHTYPRDENPHILDWLIST